MAARRAGVPYMGSSGGNANETTASGSPGPHAGNDPPGGCELLLCAAEQKKVDPRIGPSPCAAQTGRGRKRVVSGGDGWRKLAKST